MQSLKNLKLRQRKIERAYLGFLKKRTKVVNKPHSYFFVYSDFKHEFPSFCLLYKTNKICHNVKKDEFDCWNGYCPYYDYKYIDEIKGLVGRCKKNGNNGKYTNDVWDCSNCTQEHKY